MSKVITFSAKFPSYHPRAGEPTHFVEKIWESLIQLEEISISRCCELSRETMIGGYTMNSLRKINFDPKFHTIRAGHRFKVGDWFSPRVWSGKPYNSKQIIIAPDIQVKKVWDIRMNLTDPSYDQLYLVNEFGDSNSIDENKLASNDGLTLDDFYDWFNIPKNREEIFIGQIICWNEKIEY